MGATFEGDNVAKVGAVTLKRWTTSSQVTALVPDELFEFIAEGYTTWRYEFEERDGSTAVTESFEFPSYEGWQKFVYGTLMKRTKGDQGDGVDARSAQSIARSLTTTRSCSRFTRSTDSEDRSFTFRVES